MRYSSEDALLAKCKKLDFSVESANYDKNLEILKGKLANINEERCTMKGLRRIKKPFAILAAVIAVMILSAATLAASPALRDRVIRAVRHDDGSVTISMSVDRPSGSLSVREEDGVITVISDCGEVEIIDVQDATDLCPDDELLHYRFYRPESSPGLEGFINYTADLDDLMINYFTSDGFGYIQLGDHTVFYRMTDDYGIVEGNAVVETDGSVYFVAECGERTRILAAGDLN